MLLFATLAVLAGAQGGRVVASTDGARLVAVDAPDGSGAQHALVFRAADRWWSTDLLHLEGDECGAGHCMTWSIVDVSFARDRRLRVTIVRDEEHVMIGGGGTNRRFRTTEQIECTLDAAPSCTVDDLPPPVAHDPDTALTNALGKQTATVLVQRGDVRFVQLDARVPTYAIVYGAWGRWWATEAWSFPAQSGHRWLPAENPQIQGFTVTFELHDPYAYQPATLTVTCKPGDGCEGPN